MASITLKWAAGGGSNSTGQRVEYKLASASTWTAAATLANNVTTYTIQGLADNTIYDVRVLNLCNDGGPTAAPSLQQAYLTCPSVAVSAQSTSISYSFANLGGDVKQYKVELLNAAGSAVLQTQNITTLSATLTGTFSGLTASTSYQIRVTVFAGATNNYSKTCPNQAVSTTAPSPCNAPTNVTATIGA